MIDDVAGHDKHLSELPVPLLPRPQVRQIEEFEFPDAERSELGQRGSKHLDGAELQRLHLFFVLVERRVAVHLNPALGQFICLLGKKLRGYTLGCVERHDVTELGHDWLLSNGAAKCGIKCPGSQPDLNPPG